MKKTMSILLLLLQAMVAAAAESYIANVYGRQCQMLNGKWNAIVDPYGRGADMRVYLDSKPLGKTDFYEYSFDGGLRLDVPGDWNSQRPELTYYEGTVWYARHFEAVAGRGRRFLCFAGVSNRCNVYLNGQKVGSHEGAFTPFQVEVTGLLRSGDNLVVVEVDNTRRPDAIPAMSFDWWNYGGITRDVMLVTLPDTYISDYMVQLDKHRPDVIHAVVSLSADRAGVPVTVRVAGLGKAVKLVTDASGRASGSFRAAGLRRWSPEEPVLYRVEIATAADTVCDRIGFRNIEARGTKIMLNGKETFLRSVSFHEEIPQRKGRACTEADAEALLGEAKALGVNMVRLAHYQQNEYIVRKAEQMGIMLWQEIPVWQAIDFANKATLDKARQMLRETIRRDRNRCADCFWGIANETRPSAERDSFLSALLQAGREMDTTRLFVGAFDNVYFNPEAGRFEMHDSFASRLDMIGVNKYMGWYAPWPVEPSECLWQVATDKPLFISEFGGEALYGQGGDETVASSWSEDYQARLYRDNIAMFGNIPNLVGVSPWVLFDFRSPTRFHPANQEGWNRKGLVSDRGQRKKAWYVVRDYYRRMGRTGR